MNTTRGAGYQRIAPDVKLGCDVKIHGFVNLYGSEIGSETKVGNSVKIQKGARSSVRCKVSRHTLICEGVEMFEGVFGGHGVTFVNERHPQANHRDEHLQPANWHCQSTLIEQGASISSGANILGGVTVGENAIVGAGSGVTRDVPSNATVAGPRREF